MNGSDAAANSANFATPWRIVKLSADNDLMGQTTTSPRITSFSKKTNKFGKIAAPKRGAFL
jgi:hypothetical protein